MKKICNIVLLLGCFLQVHSQSANQNCMGAIPICQNSYTQSISYSGAGTINELNGSNQGCLTTGENNSVWYIFNTATSGTLVFTISPIGGPSDYDFAVWDLTDKSCSAIASGLQPIRCNYASLANSTPGGATGLSTSSASASIGAGGTGGGSFSSAISATSGQTFVIMINNSSASTNGYNINFSGSTCQILDNVSPFIKGDTIAASCTGPSSIKVLLSENIICSSFATNGSDFHLSPATATITSASSASCSTGGSYSNLFTINFSSPLSPGNYTLSIANGTDGNTLIDNCGNAAVVGSSINFTIVPPVQATVSTQFGCAGTPSGAITVSNIGGTGPFTYKLNSGAFTSSNVFSGLYAGTYTITIKDINGCTNSTVVNLIQGPQIGILSAAVTNLTCYGINTGSVLVDAYGGVPPLTYAAGGSGYQASNMLTNLSPGNYIIKIKDANGCIEDTLIFISSPGQISINSLFITNTSCGNNNGALQVNAFGGVSALNYAINSNPYQSTGNFSNLAPGSYVIHIKDANNCLKDTIVNIVPISLVGISSLNNIQPSCAGNSGSISVVGNSGTLPYSYSINGTTFTTANSFASLSSGSYTVTIKDANGCTASSNTTLTSPSNLYFTNSSAVTPTCLVQGSITVHGTGGSSPYLFALNSGAYSSSFTFTPLVPGTYLVHVKDNNGCIHDSTIILANSTVPVIGSLTNINPSCSFPTIGSIALNATGGTLPLNYSINGAAYVASSSFTGLSGGNFTVTVKDANGCTSSSVTNLVAANVLNFTSFNHTNVGCNGTPLASVTASLGNGNAPYQYSLNGSAFQASGNFTSLNAGTYTVIAKDASGCTKSSVVIITSSSVVSINTINTTSSNCYTPATGSISISGTVSASPISYSLNYGTAGAASSFNSLAPGIYTISVNDANGCHKDSVVAVSGPPAMSFSNASIVYTPCSGGTGSISLQGAGGIPAYTFSLNSAPYTGSSNWPSLAAGNYTIHLKDANGCTHDTIIDLLQPPPITFSSVVLFNPSCSGGNTGTISFNATSGVPPFQYALNAGAYGSISTFPGLGAGTYVMHAKDANGCSKDSTVTLSNSGNLTISNIVKVMPACYAGGNGTITFSGIGGVSPYQYALNTGAFGASNNFSGLSSGTYTLHAKDNGGCFKDSVITLSQPPILGFSSIQKIPPSCYGGSNGSIVAIASGGTPACLCSMDGGIFSTSGTYTNLSAGTHTISLLDSKGCTRDSIVFLSQPSPIYFANATVVNPGCLGTAGFITVGASGGTTPYTFAIGISPYTSSGTFNNLPQGIYTLHVKDNHGCVHDTVISIVNSTLITLNSISSTPILCTNGNTGFINSNATSLYPPINYSYNGGATQTSGNFSGLTPGTYTVHIEDQIGCFVDSIVTIQAAPPIQINNIILTPALCHSSTDGSITVNAIGGLGTLRYAVNASAYSFSNSISNLGSGVYMVHIKDSIACQKDSVVTISAPSAIYFSSINLVHPYCSNATDGKITINASGGQPPYIYAINTSLYTTNNLFQNLFQGAYTVHVKDYNGCVHDTIINLSAMNYMDFTNVVITDVNCKFGNDGSISIGVIGGTNPYQFTINSVATGTNSYFGNLGVGSYTINVTDLLGCEEDTVLAIHEPLFPVKALIVDITPNLCRGDSIGTITASGTGGTPPYTYSINGGSTFQSSPLFTALTAGSYFITIKDFKGCIDDSLAIVIEPDTSVQLVLIGIKDQSCADVIDGAITVNSKYGFQPINYYLDGASKGLDTLYKNLGPGNYIVEVKDGLGCKSTGKFTIKPSDRRPYIIIDSMQGILCAGDNEGALDWHTINTFPPYYYTFNSTYLGTVSYMDKISNGNYFIQVVDSIGCHADTTVSIVERDSINLHVIATPALCQGLGDDGKAIAVVVGGQGPFTYSWDGNAGNSSDHAGNLWYGPQIAYVTDGLGCDDSAHFEVEYDPCCTVNLPNAFSPNDDGKNDIFKVIKYGYITLVSFEVYNRWGQRVFGTTVEGDGWDGKYLSSDCELGTYYYLLRYKCHLKNETIMLKGDVTLIR